MEKCHITYSVRLKCEESSHYKRNYLPYRRSWLSCTCYCEYKVARTCENLKRGTPPGFCLFHS